MRALDLGSGSGTLSFADSSPEDWTGYHADDLTNYALGSSKLRFGTSNAGLTATQLSQMQFADFANVSGVIDDNGYVTPKLPNLPKITGITHSGGSVQLVWTAVNGRTYAVWFKDTLGAGSWDNPTNVLAAGDTASCIDPSPSRPTGRYYRVELLP